MATALPMPPPDRPPQPRPEIGQNLIVIRKWEPATSDAIDRAGKKGFDPSAHLHRIIKSEMNPADAGSTQMISQPGAQTN